MSMSLNRENDEKLLELVREIRNVAGMSDRDIVLSTTEEDGAVTREVVVRWTTHNSLAKIL